MKQIASLTLALVLTAALFTGCGCEANVSTHPGGMITEEATRPSIMPKPTATHETSRPTETTRATVPTESTGENSMPTDTTTGHPSTTETTSGQRNRNRDMVR